MYEAIVRMTEKDGKIYKDTIGQIVRCKDCAFFSPADQNDSEKDLCFHIMMVTHRDGFCCDGQRKRG